MISKYAPTVTSIVCGGTIYTDVPVTSVRAYPAGQHPASPLISTCTAIELVTPRGSRWHGFASAHIDGSLRMACELLPGQENDEVLATWITVGSEVEPKQRKASGSEPRLSNGCSRYGADMGRRNHPAEDASESLKFRVYQMTIDSGGYDNGGAYWGCGEPMFRAIAEDSDGELVEHFMRARNRDAAKAEISARYTSARFYR